MRNPTGRRLPNWLFLCPQELQGHLCWDSSLEPSRIRSRSAVTSRSLDRRSEAPSPRGGEARGLARVPGSQGPFPGTADRAGLSGDLTRTTTRSLLKLRENTHTKLKT